MPSYVAAKDMIVGKKPVLDDDGEPVVNEATGEPVLENIVRHAGDLVPEAKDWPNVHNYVSTGQLQVIPDELVALAARCDQLEAAIAELRANQHTHNKNTTSKTEPKEA